MLRSQLLKSTARITALLMKESLHPLKQNCSSFRKISTVGRYNPDILKLPPNFQVCEKLNNDLLQSKLAEEIMNRGKSTTEHDTDLISFGMLGVGIGTGMAVSVVLDKALKDGLRCKKSI